MLHCRSLLHQTAVCFSLQLPSISCIRVVACPPLRHYFCKDSQDAMFVLFQVVPIKRHPGHRIDFVITHFYCLIVAVSGLERRNWKPLPCTQSQGGIWSSFFFFFKKHIKTTGLNQSAVQSVKWPWLSSERTTKVSWSVDLRDTRLNQIRAVGWSKAISAFLC